MLIFLNNKKSIFRKACDRVIDKLFEEVDGVPSPKFTSVMKLEMHFFTNMLGSNDR